MIGEAFERDALAIAVDVSFDDGAPVSDLDGATVEVTAKLKFSGGGIAGTGTVTGPSEVTASWPLGALSAGSWWVEIRLISGGYEQTILQDDVLIKRNL